MLVKESYSDLKGALIRTVEGVSQLKKSSGIAVKAFVLFLKSPNLTPEEKINTVKSLFKGGPQT